MEKAPGGEQMKVIFEEVLEDWREDICGRCGSECHPSYRFCYYTEKSDSNDSTPLADFEIEVCRNCCSKVERNWKSKCGYVSSINDVIKNGGDD